MAAASNRLDRFLARTLQRSLKQIRLDLAKGRVKVDSALCDEPARLVHQFTRIVYDGQVLQNNQPVYILLHKPVGVVCATKDAEHKTVIDLIDHPQRDELHIVGRLDLNSSGLVLLTNDGRWSSVLTDPEQKVPKVYNVEVEHPLTASYITAFAEGMYFEYENHTTAPALLKILSTHTAQVVLTEGKYHQIKRMFGRFRNPVLKLHRVAIGDYHLPSDLKVGEWRLVS
ncbi:pseudouridine synthase [Nitrincola sp. A-D6]|uniref:pseudouridine synthase n=1 Tax=Nitrincola sp. A-D6 TaxID=1545442 RepID=UPI00051FCC7E|nr:pseudouridine synthase [Nitrincola sp. A-D6]KGK42229.1 pseudouridine synthase [Nitrincola sp. A-D6]